MDFDQVRTVLAIERTGSFTRAAEMLHLAQSTVTARVHQLEQELDTVIWDRTTRHVSLTPQGERLLPLFERAEILFDRIADVAESSDDARRLVFGSVHSQWSVGIIPMMESWARSANLRWRLVTAHSGELLQWVRDGSIDIAVTYFPGGERGLVSVLWAEHPLVLLGSPDLAAQAHQWTNEEVRARKIAYLEWGPPFTEWFGHEFDGVVPAVQVDQAPLLLQVLSQGGYVGFMPKALADDALRRGQATILTYLSRTPLPVRSVYMVSSDRALQNRGAASVWAHITDQVAGGPWQVGEDQ